MKIENSLRLVLVLFIIIIGLMLWNAYDSIVTANKIQHNAQMIWSNSEQLKLIIEMKKAEARAARHGTEPKQER
jgi:CHASE3 domain sensor protein